MLNKTLLQNARDLIAGGWTQGAFTRDGDGVGSTDWPGANPVSYCAVGALIAAGGYIGCEEHHALKEAAGESIVRWNDTPGRTKEDVIALFDKVIA